MCPQMHQKAAPGPAGGASNASPGPLAGFKWQLLLREGEEREGRREEVQKLETCVGSRNFISGEPTLYQDKFINF